MNKEIVKEAATSLSIALGPLLFGYILVRTISFFGNHERIVVLLCFSWIVAYGFTKWRLGRMPLVIWLKHILLRTISKSNKELLKIEQYIIKKEKLLNDNKDLLEKDIVYGGVDRKLYEFKGVNDIPYFLNPESEPRKRIETIHKNTRNVKFINARLIRLVSELSKVTEREEQLLMNRLEINTKSESELEKLKKSVSGYEHLKEFEENRLESLHEKEEKIVTMQYLKNKTILNGIRQLLQSLEQEKSPLEEIKIKSEKILDASSDPSLRTGIIDNLRGIMIKNDEVISVMNKEKPKILQIVSEIQKEKYELETKIEKDWKEIEKRIADERYALLHNKIEHEEDKLRLPAVEVQGTEVKGTEIEIASMPIFVAKISEMSGREFNQKVKEDIIKFIKKLGGASGERLAARISREVNKTGKEGLEELKEVLKVYFDTQSI